MEKIGLTRDDLAIFGMSSLEARQRAVDERLRPPLEQVALRFAAPLSRFAGEQLSAAITLPQGDSVKPAEVTFFVPGDGSSKPHFRFTISRGGVHTRLAILREAPGREALAKKLSRAAAALAKELNGNDVRRYDDWDGRGLPAPSDAHKAPFWKEVAERLGRVGGGSLDIGLGWPEARATLLAYEDLLPAWRTLVPLWKRLV